MPGIFELMIVGAIVVLAAGTLFLYKRLPRIVRWLLKNREERALRRSVTGDRPLQPPQSSPRWLPLPCSLLAVGLLVAVFRIVTGPFEPGDAASRDLVGLPATLLATAVALAGLLVHFWPGGSRWLKYELFMASALILLSAPFALWRPRGPLLVVGGVVLLLNIGAAALIYRPGRRQVESKDVPRRWILRLRWLLASVGSTLLAMGAIVIVPAIIVPYLLLRYVVGERLGHRPILFLRSFSEPGGSETFGRIVAPVASRYGVVTGLVHTKQSASTLQSRTKMAHHGHFSAVSDEEWPDWVRGALRNCSAVVISVGAPLTAGLENEVKWAEELAPDRTVLLYRGRQSEEQANGTPLTTICYDDHGPDGLKKALAALAASLRSIVWSAGSRPMRSRDT